MKKYVSPAFALLLAALLLTGCAPAQAPAPTPAPTPTATPGPLYSVTEGGFAVATDYSAYAAKKPIEPVYTRLRDEHIPDLLPSDDYGTLYPFVGSLMYGELYGQLLRRAGGMYGLIDGTGRIVADPTYSRISQLGYLDPLTGEYRYVPMYLLSRSDVDRAPPEGYFGLPTLSAIASLDGSFVTECVYGYVAARDFGVVCADSWELNDFVVYDYEGKVIMTDEEYEPGPLARARYLEYLSGGKLIYTGADGRQGVARADGSFLIEPVYEYVAATEHGYICATGDGTHSILGHDGREIFSVDSCDYMWGVDFGFVGWDSGYDHGTGASVYYAPDGALLCAVPADEGWWEVGEVPLLVRNVSRGIELMDIVSGETLFVETGDERSWCSSSLVGAGYVLVRRSDGLKSWLVRCGLTEILPTELSNVGSITDTMTGEVYYFDYDSDKLYGSGLEYICGWEDAISILNGRVLRVSDESCTHTSLDGEVLFRYPFVMSGAD